MQNLVLDCKIKFVTSLIMLVGTEADVIVVELGFTAPQQFSGHMECSGFSLPYCSWASLPEAVY